jgi:UDP-N-acetylmuramate--alanine ligase
LEGFSQSFADADQVVVLDIYGSAREKQGGIHSRDLAAAISRYHREVEYIPDIPAAFDFLKERLSEKDVLIVMGAGDVNKLGERLVALN